MDAMTRSPEVAFPHVDGVKHSYVDLPGLRMHVAEAGAGDPVLLLHGFPQNWFEFREVIPALAARYRVICPDLRGAGWTAVPPDGYHSQQLQADALALMESLRVDRVHILGHDWGALLGFDLALNHPQRVRSLVSVATPHPYIRFHPKLLLVLWRLWFQFVLIAPGLGPWLLNRKSQRLNRYLLTSNAHKPFSEADLQVFTGPFLDRDRARAGTALYRGFIMKGAMQIMTGRYRKNRLTTPTVVLYGAADPALKPELLGGYEEHTDDLTVVLIDDAAHFAIDDRPDAVIEQAEALFART
jgi:pimeloyl-ACP methyl ester carboxylesterase